MMALKNRKYNLEFFESYVSPTGRTIQHRVFFSCRPLSLADAGAMTPSRFSLRPRLRLSTRALRFRLRRLRLRLRFRLHECLSVKSRMNGSIVLGSQPFRVSVFLEKGLGQWREYDTRGVYPHHKYEQTRTRISMQF